jgi:hypothetical protein
LKGVFSSGSKVFKSLFLKYAKMRSIGIKDYSIFL